MPHATMRGDAVGALVRFFLPKLLECEDFDRFEQEVLASMRSLAALDALDARLREQAPRSWSARGRARRTPVTLLGEASFSRTVFLDEFGRRRARTSSIKTAAGFRARTC